MQLGLFDSATSAPIKKIDPAKWRVPTREATLQDEVCPVGLQWLGMKEVKREGQPSFFHQYTGAGGLVTVFLYQFEKGTHLSIYAMESRSRYEHNLPLQEIKLLLDIVKN